ncbi:MAG: family 16 glycoside hydrolase, partial [Saprospiraceae bacterium]
IIGLEPIPVPDNLKAIRSWFKVAPGQELHLLAGRTFPVTNNDPNLAHFSLSIPDAYPVEAFLKEKGLPYLRQKRFDGAWQIYVADPDGYFIELNEPKVPWVYLLNGKDLSGWDTYLGPQFPTVGEDRKGVAPIGLNMDPKKTFSMVTEDGLPALHISGEQFGGISTLQEFENYHLQMQFKWGSHKYHPKENAKMDSGVLYHANGPHGVDWGCWMQSQEFQVQEADCGDYWGVAGGTFEIPARKLGEKDWIYAPTGERMTFAETAPNGRHCVRAANYENPSGQWNTLDLYCFGDTAVQMVNGQVVMVLYHSKHPVGNGMAPLTKGKIQLQSEGAEIFYRNIRMVPIEEIPKALTGS